MFLSNIKIKDSYDPNLKRDLKAGWMRPYLIQLDYLIGSGRWILHISKLQTLPKEKYPILFIPDPEKRREKIFDEIIDIAEIPQIDFCLYQNETSLGRRMIQTCLDALNENVHVGQYERLEFLVEWLLWSFGHPGIEEPEQRYKSNTPWSIILYQLFNLEPLLAYPYDYWANLLAESESQSSKKKLGYFPTPAPVSEFIAKIAGHHIAKKGISERICEPCVGTGSMLLHASNLSLNLVGVDINPLALKLCLINSYLFIPWMAQPIWYLRGECDLLLGNALIGRIGITDESDPKYLKSLVAEPYQDFCSNIVSHNGEVIDLLDKHCQNSRQALMKQMQLTQKPQVPDASVVPKETDKVVQSTQVKPKSQPKGFGTKNGRRSRRSKGVKGKGLLDKGA